MINHHISSHFVKMNKENGKKDSITMYLMLNRPQSHLKTLQEFLTQKRWCQQLFLSSDITNIYIVLLIH